MFGYVMVKKPELKIREYEMYRAYYCGLCHSLKKNHGMLSQMTLSYDITFLVLLLTGLYEPKERICKRRCPAHPAKAHIEIENEISSYGSDMNLLLTYYKCIDDWKDERKASALAASSVFRKEARRVAEKYPQKARVICRELKKLSQYEAMGETNVDKVSGCFGRLLAEIFAWKQDEWELSLRTMGFYLGKFIYLADAVVDYEEDKKKGSYNVLFYHPYDKAAWKQMLTLMMTECAKTFERLPILKNAEIIRNILYAGVWEKLSAKEKGGASDERFL